MANGTEQNGIFREKSISRISSPEDLSDYVRVASPGIWMVLLSVIILLAGVFVWAILGNVETTVSALCVAENGKTLCYVSEKDINTVKTGMTVRVSDGTELTVVDISHEAGIADDVLSEYERHNGGFSSGEWIYAVETESAEDEEKADGSAAAVVVVNSIHPIKFIFN